MIPLDDYNGWADYWFHTVGVNVIPAGFIEVAPGQFKKQPIIEWKSYQSISVSIDQHEEWKKQNKYKNGFAIVMGRIWRGVNEGYSIRALDSDNKCADEELTIGTSDLSIMIERRGERSHRFIISKQSIPDKNADNSRDIKSKKDSNAVPPFEIKGSSKKLIFPTPNGKDGDSRYKLESEEIPHPIDDEQCDKLISKLNEICVRNGLSYLEQGGNGNGLKPIKEILSGNKKTPV
jgi:hypothetical protein